MAERYRVQWTYEGSSMASYETYDLAGAERYRARLETDPIVQDIELVEVTWQSWLSELSPPKQAAAESLRARFEALGAADAPDRARSEIEGAARSFLPGCA